MCARECGHDRNAATRSQCSPVDPSPARTQAGFNSSATKTGWRRLSGCDNAISGPRGLTGRSGGGSLAKKPARRMGCCCEGGAGFFGRGAVGGKNSFFGHRGIPKTAVCDIHPGPIFFPGRLMAWAGVLRRVQAFQEGPGGGCPSLDVGRRSTRPMAPPRQTFKRRPIYGRREHNIAARSTSWTHRSEQWPNPPVMTYSR